MGDVSKGEGRTVLFVSHNLTAVKTLCNNGLVLKDGNLIFNGEINNAIIHYNGDKISESLTVKFDQNLKDYNNENFALEEIKIIDVGGNSLKILDQDTEFYIQTECMVKTHEEIIHLSFVFKNSENLTIFTATNAKQPLHFGKNKVNFKIPPNFLNLDKYTLDFYAIADKRSSVIFEEEVLSFTVLQGKRNAGDWMGKEPGFITTNFEWNYV